jgi:hypothetical protein
MFHALHPIIHSIGKNLVSEKLERINGRFHAFFVLEQDLEENSIY